MDANANNNEISAEFEIDNVELDAEFELSESANFDAIFELYASGTTWGTILGDINNQTDLMTALNLKADKTAVAEQIETVTDLINLTSETLDNKIDDVNTLLSGGISTLTNTVNTYNTELNSRIDTLELSIDSDITELNTHLSDLADTVNSNYTELLTNIQNEATTRAANDTLLQGDIDALSGTVTSNYNTLDSKINTEISNRTASDTALQNSIDAETLARQNADTVLQSNINTLAGTVSSNYMTLNTKIDNTKNALDSDISDLASTVSDNYTSLVGRITANTGNIATNAGNIAINTNNIATNTNNISAIQGLIPNQATAQNQLADKDFVNSSIATNTAYFIGTFNSVAELEAYSGTLTNNDYAFVTTTDTAGNTLYDRYKWNGTEWLFEYELNNSSFTAAQWAAINSGATSTNIGQIAVNTSDIADLQTNKQDNLTAGVNIQINNNVISATDTTYTAGTGISIVNGVISNTQTSAEWGNIQGTLSNQTDLQNALNAKYDASNPNGYTSNVGTVTSVNNTQPDANGNVSITMPGITVDQSYDPTSVNAQSGVAIDGAKFIQNKASDEFSIAIANTYGITDLSTQANNIAIGGGINIDSNGYNMICIGGGYAHYVNSYEIINISTNLTGLNNHSHIILLGGNGLAYDYEGNNFTDYSFYVGTTGGSMGAYKLLDLNSGEIPDARLSSNIARTSDIPTLSGYATQTWVTNQNFVNSSTLTTTLADYVLSSDLSTTLTNYVTDSSLSTTLADYQPKLVSGTNIKTVNGVSLLGSGNITIQSAPDIDNTTITTNTSDELQTVAVIDDNGGSAIKTWTGTKAQYDAIVTKDATTLYNIVDDTDATLTLLELLFPVGAVYFGTMSTCPLQTLGVGTWQALPSDKVIQIAGTRGAVNTTIAESLPNIRGELYQDGIAAGDTVSNGLVWGSGGAFGALTSTGEQRAKYATSSSGLVKDTIPFSASNISSTYQDDAPVQPDAYLLNGWRRIA